MSGSAAGIDAGRKITDQEKAGRVVAAAKAKRTREQGVGLIALLRKSARLALLLLIIWLIGCCGFSLTWVLLGTLIYTAVWEYKRMKKVKDENATITVATGAAADELSDDAESLLARVDELPQWVRCLALMSAVVTFILV
jgi:hypothetical protein